MSSSASGAPRPTSTASSSDDVHFHEVGALDSIADIVGVCAGMVRLGLDAVHCSPVAVGSGTVATSHGQLSVPPPAVVELLRGIPTYAGPAVAELCTPTGAALLAHWATSWGPQPPMLVDRVGTGAGGRDFSTHPNVVRILVGQPGTRRSGVLRRMHPQGTATVLETNVDDLDPRLWPPILQRLLDAGASDAWLTPILMKKGRPAHTLSVLVARERAAEVREVIFAETSAIGLRQLRGRQARAGPRVQPCRRAGSADRDQGRKVRTDRGQRAAGVRRRRSRRDSSWAGRSSRCWRPRRAAAWKQWDRG